MSVRESAELSSQPELLNQTIKKHVRNNWFHNFEVGAERNIILAEALTYRHKALDALFGTLFVDQSVLVLNEESGLYPAVVHRAGSRAVTASNANQRTCRLIGEVSEFLQVPATIVKSKMVAFYDSEPYVDMGFAERHEFLLAIAQTWAMFGASGGSFDAMVEACTFFVTRGLVFDWMNAEWASPPPPDHYNLAEFCSALRRKFEFVTCYADWLVVAVGKLPAGDDEGTRRAGEDVGTRPAAAEPDTDKEFLARFQETVFRAVPPDATVIVVSRGDPELLSLDDRTAWHFPRTDDGDYAGYHPADSASAISLLEALRAQGGDFLVFPKPSFWWLEHYREFHQHLKSEYSLLLHDEDTCMIFGLGEKNGGQT